MKKHPIATIINFCSNETRFIKANIEQAKLFSRQVIVPVCDHFFDGTPENRELLEQVYAAFPGVLFLEYPYEPQKIPKRIFRKIEPAHFWHSLSRLIGTLFLQDEIESVLFLDADEVADGERFNGWLDSSDYTAHTALKLSNYWYFREACNQAVETEDSIVLAQRKALENEIVLHVDERDAVYNLLPGPKRRHVKDHDGKPMFHHFSWVRTQEEMLKKVTAWGHKDDRNWIELVKEEFQRPFGGQDFIHKYNYQIVEPAFDIRLTKPTFERKGCSQPTKLGSKEVLHLLKKKYFWNLF